MTTTVANLETIQKWLRDGICSRLKFKKPDDNKVDGSYQYELVNPEVHLMFVPTGDTMPVDKSVIPSICVQFDERTDRTIEKEGIMHIRLQFAVWDPGIHKESGFERNREGWRDVWNFIDATLEDIRNSEFIGNIRVMKEREIKCGPVTERGAILDFYPYWFAYISFYGEFITTSTKKEYNELL
jgi:hypothetical protein